jgi:hypothetical protein
LIQSVLAPEPIFDWEAYLAMMLTNNHNFMRLWQWEQSAWAPWTPDKIIFRPEKYLRTGPGTARDGGLKFDLKKFNPAYFERMRARVTSAVIGESIAPSNSSRHLATTKSTTAV